MLEDKFPKGEKLKKQNTGISKDALVLAEKLLDVAQKVKVQKLEKSEEKQLKKEKLPEAHFYKLLATIDLEHDDNIPFRQGIMLLVDALTHVQKDHPEILVAGEDQEHAEVQLVAKNKETLENIPYAEAKKFLAEAKKRLAA